MSDTKKAIIYPNAENDPGFKVSKTVTGIFERLGWSTELCAYPDKPDLSKADMLITFGGDGTILHAARYAAVSGVPILGINMGGKGFITELEPNDTKLIEKAATGEYDIETRMMLDIEVQRSGKTIYNDFALNDVVIKGDNKVIEMSIFADEQKITGFAGDGAIIATPTGSTAYSLSAGGPIVEPLAKNIIVTPICAHILEAKSFVLLASREITIKIETKKETPAYVSIDGGSHVNIINADAVKVTRSDKTTGLVRVSGNNFYRRLSAKLISKIN